MGDDDPGAAPRGSWTHSFEEDDEGIEVYRPTLSYAFPASRRGRRRLEFSDDEVIESAPGADDRPTPRAALQSGGSGVFSGPEGAGTLRIVELGPDILKIRRR